VAQEGRARPEPGQHLQPAEGRVTLIHVVGRQAGARTMFCVKHLRTGTLTASRLTPDGTLAPESKRRLEEIAADNRLFLQEQKARRAGCGQMPSRNGQPGPDGG
jgi:hypothetical protein